MENQNLEAENEAGKAVGLRLRAERERLSFNQTDFAKAAGVMKNTQIRYEKGLRSPDAEYLNLIASIGADVFYIITGQRSENAASSPIELSYLRMCRALPNNDARMAGNAALVAVLSMYGTRLDISQPSNDYGNLAAQDHKDYKKEDES